MVCKKRVNALNLQNGNNVLVCGALVCVTFRYYMLCYDTIRYVTLGYVTLRYVIFCYVMLNVQNRNDILVCGALVCVIVRRVSEECHKSVTRVSQRI
jgi:hypothetical protein